MGKQAAAIGARLHREIENAAKALILEIARELKRQPSQGGTPVDTGHARANWIPSVGQPNTTESDGSGNAAYQSGVVAVASYKLGQGALWVANVVPYVTRLNYGYSAQAPALFVEMAIDRALTTIQARYAGRVDVSNMASEIRSGLGAPGAENLASAYSPFGED